MAVDGDAAARRKSDVPDGAKQTVTIPAAGGTIVVGDFSVTFPANAVCKPNSGYGKRFWGVPCATVDKDVTLEAASWTENGEPFVEFLLDIRFDPSKIVVISVPLAAVGGDATGKEIFYWSRGGKGRQFVREEPTVVQDGLLTRRILHFSGYVVGSGRCEEGTEGCEGGGGQ